MAIVVSFAQKVFPVSRFVLLIPLLTALSTTNHPIPVIPATLLNKNPASVLAVFDHLTSLLGLETFRKLFPVILTDNGVEFKDPEALEYSSNGCPRTRLFYCDPQASWQKPQVENNHRLIRRILPKGYPFSTLNMNDVRLITEHINSVFRKNLDGETPFDRMTSEAHKKLLSSLNLSPIPPDEVMLKPELIKH